MSQKTGAGLAAYAIAQIGRPYWWGTYGQTASASLLAGKRKQYPNSYQATDFASQYGQKVHDCVGLIKGYLWSTSPEDGSPKYNASQDVAVQGLYNVCGKKGNIGTIPESPGVCVFMASMGHVGVYIGGGKVVEAMGHAYGVVQTNLKGRGWAYWGMPAWITYEESGEISGGNNDSEQPTAPQTKPTTNTASVPTCKPAMPELKVGSKGGYVKCLQRQLIEMGYECGGKKTILGGEKPDGEFGAKTKEAVMKVQRKKALREDGVVGEKTWPVILDF